MDSDCLHSFLFFHHRSLAIRKIPTAAGLQRLFLPSLHAGRAGHISYFKGLVPGKPRPPADDASHSIEIYRPGAYSSRCISMAAPDSSALFLFIHKSEISSHTKFMFGPYPDQRQCFDCHRFGFILAGCGHADKKQRGQPAGG